MAKSLWMKRKSRYGNKSISAFWVLFIIPRYIHDILGVEVNFRYSFIFCQIDKSLSVYRTLIYDYAYLAVIISA